MALHDYEELDEDDFYGQGFEQEGVVSIWIGTTDPDDCDPKIDVLQDLCGVGFYDLDFQEVIVEKQPTPIVDLVAALSYSESFAKAVARRAASKGRARWLVAQYDFAYDSARVKRPIAKDPRFFGIFNYRATD
jgi:hypothetical protein